MAKENSLTLDDIDFRSDLENPGTEDTDDNRSDTDKDDSQENQDEGGEGTSKDDDSQNDDNESNSDDNSDDDDSGESDDDGEDENEDDDGDENEDKDNKSEDSLVNSLFQEFGIDPEGEIEDSEEGLVEAVKQISEKQKESFFNNLMSQFPEAGELLQFMSQGGKAEKYLQTLGSQDIANVKLSEQNVLAQKQILEQKLKSEGLSDDEITEAIQEAEDANTLFSQSSRALKVLQNQAKIRKKDLLEQQAREDAQRRKAAEEEMRTVVDTVRKGQIGDLKIPESKKQAFVDFLYAPIDAKGTTRSQKAREELPTEKALQLEYLLFEGGDISKLVTTSAKNKKTRSLRSRLKSQKQDADPTQGMKGRKKRPDHTQQSDITINDIL